MKIKNIIFLIAISLSSKLTFGQKILTKEDSISNYIREIKRVTAKNQHLWDKDLYGALLFVDPVSRKLYSNTSDSAGILKTNNKIFSGVLSKNINIANTSLHWGGKDWAMILLPLPPNKHDRINLLAHELFHKVQPSLGFLQFNTQNNHLDQKDGRIYLRLELSALKKAIYSSTIKEITSHLTNALTFRKYRYSIYPGADSTENFLELNEGIAEYTGAILSGRNRKQSLAHFEKNINTFLSYPTFVRSFAYQTIPVYGYLLHYINQYWNKQITTKTNLTNYFINAFRISLDRNLKNRVQIISGQYNVSKIIQEETEREIKTKQLVAEYKKQFIEQSHFEIRFEQMNVSFNPGNIMPIENSGTFYPTIRVTDKWGILVVEKGALMSTDWDKISLTIPIKTENKNISGIGWILELSDGYAVAKNETNGNFELIKK